MLEKLLSAPRSNQPYATRCPKSLCSSAEAPITQASISTQAERRATLLEPAAATAAPPADVGLKQLRNQFNFNERAAQVLVPSMSMPWA